MDPQHTTESSWQSTNIETIFTDLGQQVAALSVVRGHSLAADVRDRILISLTMIQNNLNSKVSTASGQQMKIALNHTTHLETIFCLIDCCDLIVSYCSSQLVKALALQPSYQDVMTSVFLHQWTEMLSLHCTSSAGVLHRIEILRDIFSKRFTNSLSDDFKVKDLQMVIGGRMVEQWKEFLHFIFNSDANELRRSHLYPNIIQSTCCLWMKLIRREALEKSSIEGSDSTDLGNIFSLTDVLLERLMTGSLSQICHRKCLGVLLECLPYSSVLSLLKVIPSRYHDLARRNLCAFKKFSLDDFFRVENRDDVSDHFQLKSNWMNRCVMRNCVSQGFGGFCRTTDGESGSESGESRSESGESRSESGESRSESGVDGERSLFGDGVISVVDETVLRKVVLLWLRLLAVEAHASRTEEEEERLESSVDDVCLLLNELESFVCSVLSSNPNVWLMRLFDEQDDDLFDALLCLLDVYVLTSRKRRRSSFDVNWKWKWKRFDPCRFFIQFLSSGCCWDHTLLVDLLMSPETCFLIYLTRLLKHIVSDWKHWVSVCQDNEDKDDNSLSAAELNFGSSDNKASLDEFNKTFEVMEMKWSGSSVERSHPLPSSSAEQMEEEYNTSLLIKGNSVASPSYSSSFLRGKSDPAIHDLHLSDVRNRSSIKKLMIVDYSDSDESDGSDLSADDDADDDKLNPSNRQISSDDLFMSTDSLLPSSSDLDVKTSENCFTEVTSSFNVTNDSNDVEADSVIQKHSSASHECHSPHYSNQFSFTSSEQSAELSDCSNSRMKFETNCAESDVMLDDVIENEFGTSVTSTGNLTTEGKEKCDIFVDAMTTLIRLRLCLTRLISKDIFPYDISPLERLLELCEESYENCDHVEND